MDCANCGEKIHRHEDWGVWFHKSDYRSCDHYGTEAFPEPDQGTMIVSDTLEMDDGLKYKGREYYVTNGEGMPVTIRRPRKIS